LIQLVGHSVKTGVESAIYARSSYGSFRADSISVLQTRAWAYQETVLPRRRLCYTDHGLTWNCVTAHDSCHERRPHEVHGDDLHKLYIRSTYDIDHQIPTAIDDKGGDRIMACLFWWYRQVDEYAVRRMTFPKDKFPWFCGLVTEFAKRTSYHWKAGVEDFRCRLLWARGWWGRISWDFSPSWSWAALQPVRSSDAMDYPYKSDIRQCTYLDCTEVDLIEFVVKAIDGNPFGQVVSASITLRGLSQPLSSLESQKSSI
jgi:hypothetical protein